MNAARASILVVDDTVENLQLLAGILKEDYQVRPVTSGRQALEVATKSPPEVILLDVMMPEMDGYEVCRRLKQIPALREIPVLFLTALSETADKLQAFEVGGADHITKPFHAQEVLARVKVHVALRRSHRELAQSYERLQSLERVREELVEMVVHDMRSPLTALVMLLDMVHDAATGGTLDAESRDDLKAAIASAARVNRMANDVLDVSRLEEGKLPLDRVPTDLVAICNEVVPRLAAMDRKRVIAIAPSEPVEVPCDRAILGRVVENIVSNAIKHTPEAGRIDISVARVGDRARVAVQDQGRGVPADAREKIFEKFGAVAARQKGAFHSTGLGLAFCRLALDAHGGTIGVDPGEPIGSIFWFELPAGEPDATSAG